MDIRQRIDAVTKISEMRIKMGGIQPPPKSVKIELVGRCNFHCKYCAVTMRRTQPKDDMDIFLFKKITDDMRISGVEEIGLFYLGESLLNPVLLIQAVGWVKRDMGFPYCFLTSNGSKADDYILSGIMSEGLDSLKWSVNFADEKQFCDLTSASPKIFAKTLENIKLAYQIRQEGGYKTMLSASSILYDDAQSPRMTEFLKENILPYVDCHYWLPLYQMSMYSEKIKKEIGYTPTAGNCGRLDETTLEPTRMPLPCWCAFTEGHVRYDGGLSACGFGCDEKFDMGVLDGTNFMRQWNSPKFQNLRTAQLKTLTNGQGALVGTPCEVCVAYE